MTRLSWPVRAGVFLLGCSLLLVLLGSGRAAAQVDPQVRDRVVSAAVQIALVADVTANGLAATELFPVGSGTVVSPDGLVLTNWHVVDMATHQARFASLQEEAAAHGEIVTFALDEGTVMLLTSDDNGLPQPSYRAEIVASDHALDLAVLHIVGRVSGGAVIPSQPALSYVPIGNSDALSLADPIDIYSYPQAGGGSLTYTTGVVSGFNFEQGSTRRAWITTDAILSGGSSGGTAVNRRGQLVGVPTQGSALDCRPFDSNFDGTLDGQDVGCIPVGGSIGQLRPINLAWPLLEEAGLSLETPAERGLAKSGFPQSGPGTAPAD